MSVIAADLEKWLSEANPEDDVSTSGGAIQDDGHVSGGITPIFTPLAADDQVEVLSDGADTRDVTITGRTAAGAIVSETLTLNGTTPVGPSTNTYERILKIVLSAKDASRTVTVRRDAAAGDIATLGPNYIAARRMFYDAASEASQKDLYELFYWKQANATDTLNSASVAFDSHPAGAATIRIGLGAAKGDLASVANRETSPGVTFIDDGNSQNVPGGALAAGERIGVWIHMQLAADNAAFKGSVQTTLSGTTT